MSSDGPPICICIPARDEAARLPRLLDAIADQDWPRSIPVQIAVNNTIDDTLERIEASRRRHGARLAIGVTAAIFPPDRAHAGSARRLAMDQGLRLLGARDDGILVSTDADARPPADWLRNIVAAFADGADLVGGRIGIDPDEPLPPAAARLRAAWDLYWAAVRAIEDAIDPSPWDPPPRHGDHTGASLAIGVRTYLACGGVPLLPTGEDRALVAAAVATGARLVHPLDVRIHVSPRQAGRAEQGMAAAMVDLLAAADAGVRPMAPAFAHWRERAAWRRALRALPDGSARIAREEPALPPMPHDMPLELPA